MSRIAGRMPRLRQVLLPGIERPHVSTGSSQRRLHLPNPTRRNLALQSFAHRAPLIPLLRRSRLTTTSSSQTPPPLPEDASLTDRLKYLIKRYGWYALGMYIFFSTIDFSLTFLTINWLGAEYVGKAVERIKKTLPPIPYFNEREDAEDAEHEDPSRSGSGKNGKDSIYATAVLAYGIHKTLLLPFRVGMTAYFTPKFVGWLGARGWIGREGAKKAAAEMRGRMRRGAVAGKAQQVAGKVRE